MVAMGTVKIIFVLAFESTNKAESSRRTTTIIGLVLQVIGRLLATDA
jgi:hypothetical protein